MDPATLTAITGAASTAGNATGLFDQASYYLGELTGFNKDLENDQYRQYKRNMDLQQEYNIANMATQQDYQKQMFDYTYSKNSPKANVERLKEAGLSPSLMYSNGVASGPGGITGSAGLPSVSGGNPQSIASMRRDAQRNMDISSILQAQATASQINVNNAQSDLLKAQADKTRNADTKLTESQTALNEVNKSAQETRNYILNSTKYYEIGLSYENWVNKELQNWGSRMDNEVKQDTLPALKEQNKQLVKLTIQQIAESKSRTKLNDNQINLINEQIDKIQSDIEVNKAEIEYKEAQGEAVLSQATSARIRAIADAVGIGLDAVIDVIKNFTKLGSIISGTSESVVKTTSKDGRTTRTDREVITHKNR